MRPTAEEFAPYYSRYIDRVPDGAIADTLRTIGDTTVAELRKIPEARGGHRYEPDKWSIRQLIQHVIDAERVFTYRALRVARGDETPLAGFDQNTYAAAARADERTIAELADEFGMVRGATVALFRSLNETELARMGSASGYPVSARALAYITAGHEIHHMDILRSRYL